MNEEFDLPQRLFINWKKIGLYAFPIAVVAGLLVTKVGAKKGRAEEDYVSASAAFAKWEQVMDQGEGDFAKLGKLVKKHPELQAQYDAFIAQGLLAAISPQKAAPFVERTLQRTKQPYYSDFARTSLKISEEKYQEALNESLSLKDKMNSDPSFWEKSNNCSTLYAFNLMRIATLSQQLNHKEIELDAWKEIKRYGASEIGEAATKHVENEGFKKLLTHFSVQETTLLNYIEAREEELRNP